MYSIRGAITANNTKTSIQDQAKILFDTIISSNNIPSNSIDCVFVSTTNDLTAASAASGIRLSSLYNNNIALFSSIEPDICDSLCCCIRLLVQAGGQLSSNTPKQHIYLNGAKILRPDIARVGIALDGPSGAGKSTIAKVLSQRLGIPYLDTGAMYRAFVLKLINTGAYKQNVNDVDTVTIDKAFETTRIEFGKQKPDSVYLDGVDVSSQIRTPQISQAASFISANGIVRQKMLKLQQDIIKQTTSCILDGRDIGTVVMPDADYKFFITASLEQRAERRVEQLQKSGQIVDYQNIKLDIQKRDHNDQNREFAPLKQAEDAVLIDTTDQSENQTIQNIIDIIMGRKSTN